MSIDAPTVTIVVVNYRGADDTIACLEGIRGLDWPVEALDVVVVDNASGGDDVARIRAAAPWVELVESKQNLGFAGGCNLGARQSQGEHLAFVNNDARPDRQFLREATAALADRGVGAVAAKVVDWSGEKVDFVGSALSWYGQAFKIHVGAPDDGSYDEARDVLFGTGSALVVRRSAFEEIGGFDERYFMFFEDVDLGWRLWLAGYRVRYAPRARVLHKHHASMSKLGAWREQFLLERNALFTIYKNYDDDNLARFLAPALALAVRRGVVLGGADSSSLDLAVTPPATDESATEEVSRTLLASAYAVDGFVRELASLRRSREEIQARRQRSDGEIVRLFGQPLVPNIPNPEFVGDFQTISDAFAVDVPFRNRRRVLVLTGDTLASRMAGPAIRAFHIAKALSGEHDVVLATTAGCDLVRSEFETRHIPGQQVMAELERWADVIVFQGYLMHEYPVLRSSTKPIVVDMYDPFHLEQLEQAKDLGEERRREVVQSATAVLNEQIARGDFFLCASDKQRDFWLGQMAAIGRVNPAVYDRDETLESLISIVPFGVENEPPVSTGRAVKGVIPGIEEDAKVVLWGGGIYNWFDPLTLIRAMALVKERVPQARLLFMGVKHPNPAVPEMRMAVQAQGLAEELGLLGSVVIFNHEWVPYEQRQNFLLESDIGVSTHLDHVETAFSFRTRILDYMWTSLPVVCTQGDSLAALIEQRDLGQTVPPGDVDRLADVLVSLLTDEALSARYRANLSGIVPEYQWSRVLEPLISFCRDPRRADDLLDASGRLELTSGVRVVPPPWKGVHGDLALIRNYLKEGGPRLLAQKVGARAVRVARGQLRRRR
ncbi:glycosyltransferase [Blastococcus capsensis]|uniref:glycosyltransferase n=1 Tax=Blastococcus capsensis TaxID=1564163 RepID=UPI002540C55D|nr:glycosyltransferase [Blastococcus capsensis]MDK3256146.1 glycosyltransferase [Blastococcus capsensis]